MPEIITLKNNPELTGLARLLPRVVYSTAQGQELAGAMLVPWNENPKEPYPAIVFVQGSAWQSCDIYYELAQLAEYARRGYVVLTIVHRSSTANPPHPFPAFLEDAKTAIRFLRKNAVVYHIDPDRIGFFGTSSGGNTSMLVAMTGDDPAYKTQEYADMSDSVRCAVECFGPADMCTLFDQWIPKDNAPVPDDAPAIARGLCGNQDPQIVMKAMSPYHIAKANADYPPILMLHGDADELVPYDQGTVMYEKYLEVGADVQFIRITGAPHEDSFWSREVHAHILAFLDQHLKG